MGCNCAKLTKSPLWTPDPEYRQPTAIQPGENIDCYAARSGSVSGLKNDVGGKQPNLIDNTSLTSDLNGAVNTTFVLTPSSTRTPTTWSITVDGVAGQGPLTELSFNAVSGTLTGTVASNHLNKNYVVLITATDGAGQIDARSFNFFPKSAATSTSGAVKFIIPLVGPAGAHVTCGYGPRTPPASGASSFHHGFDFAMTDHSQGTIVASADGTVVKTGPATGFGNWIVIEHHDDVGQLVATTVYGHMNDGNTFVNVGDKVTAGQKIALEGNAGIGTAMHLHFEIHKGKWRNSTDPGPYLSGQLSIAGDNLTGSSDTGATNLGADGTAPPTAFSIQNNSNVGMTAQESANANKGCPIVLPNDVSIPPAGAENTPTPPTNTGVPLSGCSPPTDQLPSITDVKAKMQQAMDEDGTLTAYDQHFLFTVASIESSFNPYAKNPTSSATGLFQMLDSIAVHYFGVIGYPPTCANRCDPYIATKAMIAFYKSEILPYWNGFVASGKTKIANLTIKSTPWSAQYGQLSQGDFQYGICQHDGIGNGVAGIDKGGVAYWRSKTA